MICKIPSHLNHSMIKTFKCMLQALAQFERQWSLSLHSLAADSVTKRNSSHVCVGKDVPFGSRRQEDTVKEKT